MAEQRGRRWGVGVRVRRVSMVWLEKRQAGARVRTSGALHPVVSVWPMGSAGPAGYLLSGPYVGE